MKYFLREHKYEFLTSIFAILTAILSFTYINNPKIQFLLSLAIIFISLIVFVYLRTRDRDFYFISLRNRKHKDAWIGRGIFEYQRTEKCFLISDSDSGYIYSKALIWSDYSISFEFKIIENCIGAIVRAVNLSNYVMLQINTRGIRPHVRISGGWYVHESKEVNLSFDNDLSLDKWYKCLLTCEKGSINIKLLDKKNNFFDRSWNIPQGNLFFDFKKDEKDANPARIAFPINLEYGSVGFRNCVGEKALVQNLLIEKN